MRGLRKDVLSGLLQPSSPRKELRKAVKGLMTRWEVLSFLAHLPGEFWIPVSKPVSQTECLGGYR